MNKPYYLCLFLSLLVAGCSTYRGTSTIGKGVSPYDYGLRDAVTYVDNYWSLYNAHCAALKSETFVDYSGIDSLTIEIPKDAKSIPLSSINDFKGLELTVRNTTNNFILFSYEAKSKEIIIRKADIDKGSFRAYGALRQGLHVLAIQDDNIWVDNRKGYSYGHTRKDVLLIKNGHSVNSPIYPYNNEESSPTCCVYESFGPIVFQNLSFKRSEEATNKTYLLAIKGANDVTIKNVKCKTPESDLVSDYLMRFSDCTNVRYENVDIDGTYSRTDYSGYGISLNNIWSFTAKNLTCRAKWGLFGNNNVNTATLEDCSINRFDVHCYGKDFRFKRVQFNELYNQFSSVYGYITFEKCRFCNFVPVLYESAYNAFTQHDIVFKDCIVDLSASHNYLIMTGNITNKQNSRESISQKSLPNVVIENMTVNVPSNVKEMIVFRFGAGTDKEIIFNYIDRISIDGMAFICQGNAQHINLELSNRDITTDKELKVFIKNIRTSQGNGLGSLIDSSGTITLGINRESHKNTLSIKKANRFIVNE